MLGVSLASSLALLAGTGLASAAALPQGYPGNHQYDYVIVGGGVAGMVIAEQLSQNQNTTVFLLEAGPDGTNAASINTPGQAFSTWTSQYAWNYSSTAQSTLNGAAPALQQGHALGGGSAINIMAYCRGAPSVFDEWAEVSEDDGLKWENLFEDFKATVHYENTTTGPQDHLNASAYGAGPLAVTSEIIEDGFSDHFHDALASSLGLQDRDLNAGFGIGNNRASAETIRASNRTRDYALEAYGWSMAGRANAHILPNAWASKINFDGKRAASVDYVVGADNKTQTAHGREIIVTSGAINTPKLLMLSGIGPAKHLRDFNITVLLDAPAVGGNLYDHHYPVLEYEVHPNITTSFLQENKAYLNEITAEYKDNATGPLANIGTSFALARIPDDVLIANNDTFHLSTPEDRGHLLFQYGSAPMIRPAPNASIISVWVALVQPEAAGQVRLNSSDFRVAPLIDSNYYGSKNDMSAILWGYKKLRSIMESPDFDGVVKREVYPGSNVTSDADIMGALKASSQSFHHVLGSVSLGRVLDKHFRVKGVEGLRVADSSTFPSAPTCHTQADVYAVAHRVARMIREEREVC